MKKDKSNYVIRSVDSALDVLEAFHRNVEELTVTELSNSLKLSKDRIFRLLSTLESRNLIEQDKARGIYRLGLGSLQLGQAFARQAGLLRQGRAVVEDLARSCKETSSVTALSGFQTIYLYTIESDLPVRVVPQVDPLRPFYCTAAGKVLAAGVDEKNLHAYIHRAQLIGHPSMAVTDPDRLTQHLRRIAAQGYAVKNEERRDCVTDVAAPVLDFTRHVVGAVNVSIPSMRITPERMNKELIPLVTAAARQISVKLGYHPLPMQG